MFLTLIFEPGARLPERISSRSLSGDLIARTSDQSHRRVRLCNQRRGAKKLALCDDSIANPLIQFMFRCRSQNCIVRRTQGRKCAKSLFALCNASLPKKVLYGDPAMD